MPPESNSVSREPQQFLWRQPFWCADHTRAEIRWHLAIREEEPTDEASKLEPAFRPAPLDDDNDDSHTRTEGNSKWTRISREDLIGHATSDEEKWRRVGLVCGAGLGKTTNLQWLEAAVNSLDNGRGRHLALFMNLRDLPPRQDTIMEWAVNRISNRAGNGDNVKFSVERMLLAGRVTFLLDSLDQADPDPDGPVVRALGELLKGRWERCRVWVSGRPYAFRIARAAMQEMAAWQFIRIGQLDEPECRQLLETTRPPYRP